jgi:hypothetical protein
VVLEVPLWYTSEKSVAKHDGCKFSAVDRHVSDYTERHKFKEKDARKNREGLSSTVSQGWTTAARTDKEVQTSFHCD